MLGGEAQSKKSPKDFFDKLKKLLHQTVQEFFS